jgi:hypothetical protein
MKYSIPSGMAGFKDEKAPFRSAWKSEEIKLSILGLISLDGLIASRLYSVDPLTS